MTKFLRYVLLKVLKYPIQILITMVCLCWYAVDDVILPSILENMLDLTAANNIVSIWYCLKVLMLWKVLMEVMIFIGVSLWGYLIPQIEADVFMEMSWHIINCPFSVFSISQDGKFAASVSEVVDGVSNCVQFFVFKVFPSFCILFLSITYIYRRSVFISQLLFIWYVIAIPPLLFIGRRLSHKSFILFDVQNERNGMLVDIMSNSMLRTVLNLQENEFNYLGKMQNYEKSCNIDYSTYYARCTFGISVLLMGLPMFIIMYVCINEWTQGRITGPNVVFILSLVFQIGSVITDVLSDLNMLFMSDGQFQSVMKMMDYDIEELDAGISVTREDLDGEIVFSNVSIPSRGLININITLFRDKSTAILGNSGIGKSSIISCLFGLIDYEGDILINNINARDISKRSLRSIFFFMPQESTIFNRSMRDNICLGEDISNSILDTVTKRLHIHDLIKNRGGYDSVVGNKGRQISGGQAQRLCIARFLVRCMVGKAPLYLVMDESLSALNNSSKEAVMRVMKEICTEYKVGTIVITHDRCTAKQCNIMATIYKSKEDRTVRFKFVNNLYDNSATEEYRYRDTRRNRNYESVEGEREVSREDRNNGAEYRQRDHRGDRNRMFGRRGIQRRNYDHPTGDNKKNNSIYYDDSQREQ